MPIDKGHWDVDPAGSAGGTDNRSAAVPEKKGARRWSSLPCSRSSRCSRSSASSLSAEEPDRPERSARQPVSLDDRSAAARANHSLSHRGPDTRRGFSDSGDALARPSPLPCRPMREPRQRAPRAGAPRGRSRRPRPDHRVVRRCPAGRSRRSPGREVDGIAAVGQAEPDRARRAHQHLVVAVGVGGVAIARAVRPGARRRGPRPAAVARRDRRSPRPSPRRRRRSASRPRT